MYRNLIGINVSVFGSRKRIYFGLVSVSRTEYETVYFG